MLLTSVKLVLFGCKMVRKGQKNGPRCEFLDVRALFLPHWASRLPRLYCIPLSFSLSLHAFCKRMFCRRGAPAFMMESQGQRDMRFREVCFEFRANLFSVSMKRDEALGLDLFCVWVKCTASLSWMCLVFLPNLM